MTVPRITQDLYAVVNAMQLLESSLEAVINIVDGEDDEGFPLMRDQDALDKARKALAWVKHDLRGTYEVWLNGEDWAETLDVEVGA